MHEALGFFFFFQFIIRVSDSRHDTNIHVPTLQRIIRLRYLHGNTSHFYSFRSNVKNKNKFYIDVSNYVKDNGDNAVAMAKLRKGETEINGRKIKL